MDERGLDAAPHVPMQEAAERASPAAGWVLLALTVNAAFFLLAGFAPAQNGDWGPSETAWLTMFAVSIGLATTGLLVGSRLLRAASLRTRLPSAGGGPDRAVLIVLVLVLAVTAMTDLVVLATNDALVTGFEQPATTRQWVGAYLVAGSTGAAVSLLIPARTGGPSSPRSSAAVGSFVAAIVGLQVCFGMLVVPSLVAVGLGHAATRQISRAGGAIDSRDYAVLGLRLGYLGLVVGLVGWAWLVVG